MYEKYFGLVERPFSIAPDPQYLFMSQRHKEAMAHLSYGLTQGGCFIVLSGEVGTGKTTLCRNLLADLPDNVDVALILNAKINEHELLQSICDELKIEHAQDATQKQLLDSINRYLLDTFSKNRHTVLIIDEAQLLSRDVLEQIRLLTNLETNKAKLLQIILIGQPELNELLQRNDLRQLAQRVTARYHLGPLQKNEIEDYVNFRLSVAGCKRPLFSRQALHRLYALTEGIPRKINVLADHALLAAYANTAKLIDAKTVNDAAQDVFVELRQSSNWPKKFFSAPWAWGLATAVLLLNLGLWWFFAGNSEPSTDVNSIAQEPSFEDSLSADSAAQPVAQASNSPGIDSSESVMVQAPIDTTTTGSSTTPGTVLIAEQQLDDSPNLPGDMQMTIRENGIPPAPQSTPLRSTSLQSRTSKEEQAIDAALDAESQTAGTAAGNQLNLLGEAGLADSEFSRVLAASADQTSRISAFRILADAWGVELPERLLNPVCEELASKGVGCLGFETWQQFLRYNRPAILVVEADGQFHRVVVLHADADQARVRVGTQTVNLSTNELQNRWVGRGVLLWRKSELDNAFLQEGDSGPLVVATRQQLNQVLAKTSLPLLLANDADIFDRDMSQKLFALQTRFDIINDSKIGKETWFLIEELLNPEQTQVLRPRG